MFGKVVRPVWGSRNAKGVGTHLHNGLFRGDEDLPGARFRVAGMRD